MNIEQLSNTIKANSVINENTESGDIAQAPSFVGKLIHQTYSKSILSKITSIIPLKAPVGYVYSMLAYYAGKSEDNDYYHSKVLFLSANYAGTLDTNITLSNGAVITVEYAEDKHILVKVVSGTVVSGATFSGITINAVYSSKIAVKKLFEKYSMVDTETKEPNRVNIEVKREFVETQTRKLKSVITQEAVQDIQSQYGENAEDVLADIMSSEVALEMDKEIIDYMRSIATIKSDLVLTNSSIADLTYAYLSIASRINKELLGMSAKHGKNITGFVVTSNAVIAGLISAGLMAFGESGNLDNQILTDNDNTIGIMQQYVTVVQDKFATEDYVLVGWKQHGDGTNGKDGNAGVIFSPYNIAVTEWNDPETGKINKMVLNRYGYVRNAYDEGGDINSDFFSTFNVDFSNLVGYGD